MGDEAVAGEEVGILTVCIDAEQAGVKGAGAGGDQREACVRWPCEAQAGFFAVPGAQGLPLIDVLFFVGVGRGELVGGGEEDAAFVGEAQAIRRLGRLRRAEGAPVGVHETQSSLSVGAS